MVVGVSILMTGIVGRELWMGMGCVEYRMHRDCVLTHGCWCVNYYDRYCGERAIDG